MLKISRDRTTRKISVHGLSGEDLDEGSARAVADQRLADDGTASDWHFEEAEQMAYDWVNVYYSA